MEPTENKSGMIYLYDNRRLFKVGKSVNMERRDRDYITENPDNVCLCRVQVEDAAAAEEALISMTKAFAHKNPQTGNEVEWRRRCPEVIDLFIGFAEKHGIHKISVWAEEKQKLLNERANLASTQYYTDSESPSGKYWQSKHDNAVAEAAAKQSETVAYWKDRCNALQDDLQLQSQAMSDNEHEVVQITDLWAEEVKKNRELQAKLDSRAKAKSFSTKAKRGVKRFYVRQVRTARHCRTSAMQTLNSLVPSIEIKLPKVPLPENPLKGFSTESFTAKLGIALAVAPVLLFIAAKLIG